MTLKELTEFIESRHVVGEPTSTRLSVTGEPYVAIGQQFDGLSAIAGTVDEGCHRQKSLDEADACQRALTSFQMYALSRPGVLYWREKPSLERNGICCAVNMRCLISDKPAA